MARPFLSTAVVGAQTIPEYLVYCSLTRSLPFQMFLWSSVFSKEPQVPGQRSPEELVTNMLMLELGSLLKHTERLRQERAMENRRRSSSVDYSWLAAPPHKSSYEIPAGEMLELQDLCAKVSPSQCGPLILR